jgi:hypothetical protein
MTFEQYAMLAARFGTIVKLNRHYVRSPQIKSPEEIDWMRIGAALTDRGMAALRDGLRPVLTERSLADLVERSYIALGGTNVIHFFGVTPMADPSIGVPTQFVANRKVNAGDAVVAEISAAFWNIPDRCYAVLRLMRCRRSSTAICMPWPTPRSMPSPPCSRTAPCRSKSSMRRA